MTVKNGWVKNAVGTKLVDLDERILIFYRDEKSTKVGQICKNDEGGDDRNRDLMRNHFLTFTSTKMICDEVYTNLVDVKLITVDKEQFLMTIFATSEKSLPGTYLGNDYSDFIRYRCMRLRDSKNHQNVRIGPNSKENWSM